MSKVKAIFTGDSKNFHKFEIVGEGFVGSIYAPKGAEIPKEIQVGLVTKADSEYKKLNSELTARKNR